MPITCDICGKKEAHTQHVTKSYGEKNDLLVIEGIPVITCRHCGESYMTAETLHEIERIRLHRTEFAKKRSVAVAAFG
jgi:YgiT-type zinc finger domain-containing protein